MTYDLNNPFNWINYLTTCRPSWNCNIFEMRKCGFVSYHCALATYILVTCILAIVFEDIISKYQQDNCEILFCSLIKICLKNYNKWMMGFLKLHEKITRNRYSNKVAQNSYRKETYIIVMWNNEKLILECIFLNSPCLITLVQPFTVTRYLNLE